MNGNFRHESDHPPERHLPNLAGSVVAAALLTALLPLSIPANDLPAPTQLAGNHSTVATTTDDVRDDELVRFICEKIQANGGKVKDVKLMVNSCYGGGMLDDMQREFGPGGLCEGIPWVAGSASGPEQTARGWANETVANHPNHKLGSTWTDALFGNSPLNLNGNAGVVANGSASNNVLQDLQAAGPKDATGPQGQNKEAPQVASGNGGDGVQWKMDGAKHQAVVFGGLQTDQRHHNNISNVVDALKNNWNGNAWQIRWHDGGSRLDLFGAIEAAAAELDENTQLLVYIDDHGGTSFDFDEAIGAIADVLIEDEKVINFEIPDGWIDGLWGNYFNSMPQVAFSALNMDVTHCANCSNWSYVLNNYIIEYPEPGDVTGPLHMPVLFPLIKPGQNQLRIIPHAANRQQSVGGKPQTHFGGLTVSHLELTTGPINELEPEQVLLPAQSAAFFDPERSGEGIFVELLADSRAVVYVFSYTPSGGRQAWMLGVGEQVGRGIIVHEMLLPTGPSFGSDFDPDDLQMADFGTLVFLLPTCGTSEEEGGLFLYPEPETNYGNLTFSQDYTQLSVLVDCATGEGSANSPLSGSWFDPSHEGEGIILEVLKNGSAVVQWFTYNQGGQQMWIQGTGTFNGDTLTVNDLFTTSGARWGDNFDPDDVDMADWGTLTMEFDGCGEAEVNYTSQAFGSGSLDMVRLTNLMGIDCAP